MAALTVADTGLGATISGTGLITTQVVSIGEMTISVDSLDITSLDTTGFEALRPSDLRKNPEVDVVFNWLGAAIPITTQMILWAWHGGIWAVVQDKMPGETLKFINRYNSLTKNN